MDARSVNSGAAVSSAQLLLNAKHTFRDIKVNFQGLLKSSQGSVQLAVKATYPKDFPQASRLLTEKSKIESEIRKIRGVPLESGEQGESFYAARALQALSGYDADTFAHYFSHKAAKENASFELRNNFLLWAIRLGEPAQVQEVWPLCEQLLPQVLYYLVGPDTGQPKAKKAIKYVEDYLVARATLRKWLDDLHALIKQPQVANIFGRLKNKIVNENNELIDILICEYERSQIFSTLQGLQRDLEASSETREIVNKIAQKLTNIFTDYLTLKIANASDDKTKLECISIKILYDLESGRLPVVTKLIDEAGQLALNLDASRAEKIIFSKNILNACLSIDQIDPRVFEESRRTNLEEIAKILNVSLTENSPPPPKTIDPDFETSISEHFTNFADTFNRNVADAGKECTTILGLLRQNFSDQEQADRVRTQCLVFVENHKALLQSEACLKAVGKAKVPWQQIEGLFKVINKKETFEKKILMAAPPAAAGALSQKLEELVGKILQFKKELRPYRLVTALGVCREIRSLAAALKEESFPLLQDLSAWFAKENPQLLALSIDKYANDLKKIKNDICRLTLMLSGQYDPTQEITSESAEFLGDAYAAIRGSDSSGIAAKEALYWFERALQERSPEAKAFILRKIVSLHQATSGIDDLALLNICKEVESLPLQPGYFQLISHLAIFCFSIRKVDLMKNLYRQAVKHSFAPKLFTYEDGIAQFSIHINFARQLMLSKDHKEAFDLLMNLINEKKQIGHQFYREAENVVFYLLEIPQEISSFGEEDYKKLMELSGSSKNVFRCFVGLYECCLNAGTEIPEYRWNVLARTTLGSEKCQRLRHVKTAAFFDNPIEDVKKILLRFALDINAHFFLYQQYLRYEKPDLANAQYTTMLELRLDEGEAKFSLFDRMQVMLEKAQQQEINPSRYCDIADYFRKRSKKDALAEKLYQKALQIDPHHLEAWYGLGCLSLEKGQNDEALGFFKKVSEPALPDDKTHWCLGPLTAINESEIRGREREFARTDFPGFCQFVVSERMRKIGLLSAQAHLELAALDAESALTHLNQAIALHPEHPRAYYEKAKLVRDDDPAEAVLCLQKMIPLCLSWHQEAYDELRMLLKAYSTKEAASIYQLIGEKLLEQKPERVEEAIVNLEASLELYPNCGRSHLSLGDGYSKQRRYQLAMRSYAEAIRLGEDSCVVKHEEARARWDGLCSFPKYGDFFKASLERTKELAHQLRFAETLAHADSLLEPSALAKNRRQEALVQSQKLLNQCMQLLSAHFMDPVKAIPSEFPARKMVERKEPFTAVDFSSLKLTVPPIYKLLKGIYKTHHKKIEQLIAQANHEKHAHFGEQFRGSQTTIYIDHMANTETRTVRPEFYDAKTRTNPSEDCRQAMCIVESFVNTILAYLDRRVSPQLLEAIIGDDCRAKRAWSRLLNGGWIDNKGTIKVVIDEELDMEGLEPDGEKLLDYLRATTSAPLCDVEIYFDLEKKILLPGNSSSSSSLSVAAAQADPPSLVSQIAAEQIDKASQRKSDCDAAQLLDVVRSILPTVQRWAPWHPDEARAYQILGDLFWQNSQYREAMQAYKKAGRIDPAKEDFWARREQSLGDIAFQIEEAKKLALLLHGLLQEASRERSAEILNLHGELVSKLMHSLDHAIHAYCRRRFPLNESDEHRLLLRNLFFPVAASQKTCKEQIDKAFDFLADLKIEKISAQHPSFFDYLHDLQPCNSPQYEWLGILHDANNTEKHHRFLVVQNEDKAVIENSLKKRSSVEFYWKAIEQIEAIHEKIATFRNEPV